MNACCGKKLWMTFPLYLLVGLALGLADPILGRWVQHLGVRPGVATAINVNLVLSVVAIGLGAIHPRLAAVWLGAVAMTVCFILGLGLAYPQGLQWDIQAVLRSIPPVLLFACLGYGALGTLSALVIRSLLRGPSEVSQQEPA